MSDLTQRLRDRAYSGKVPDKLCEEAADEIERLRNALRADSLPDVAPWFSDESEGEYSEEPEHGYPY